MCSLNKPTSVATCSQRPGLLASDIWQYLHMLNDTQITKRRVANTRFLRKACRYCFSRLPLLFKATPSTATRREASATPTFHEYTNVQLEGLSVMYGYILTGLISNEQMSSRCIRTQTSVFIFYSLSCVFRIHCTILQRR